jgi:LmbE family N-acetylglucosaminyl deacetylase
VISNHLTLSQVHSEIFVPDGIDTAHALSRTTHLGIGAHPDDLEIMAVHGILECVESSERWFTGIVAADGAAGGASGSELAATRRSEQKRAAEIGRYGAVVLLNHPSSALKDTTNDAVVGDLSALMRATSPEVVYTHNLADAHDTHVALALAVIAACRRLAEHEKPARVIGCEVWRDLDWLPGDAKVMMPVGEREELEAELIRAFSSQLDAGKHYDRAALGRRHANATFHEIRSTDGRRGIVWGMDLTPAAHGAIDPGELLRGHVRDFERELDERLRRYAR